MHARLDDRQAQLSRLEGARPPACPMVPGPSAARPRLREVRMPCRSPAVTGQKGPGSPGLVPLRDPACPDPRAQSSRHQFRGPLRTVSAICDQLAHNLPFCVAACTVAGDCRHRTETSLCAAGRSGARACCACRVRPVGLVGRCCRGWCGGRTIVGCPRMSGLLPAKLRRLRCGCWARCRWSGRAARSRLGGPRPRAVLALLVLEAGRVVPAGRLVEEVWRGSPPPGAAKTLRSYVSRLRALLSPDAALAARGGGYVLAARSGHGGCGPVRAAGRCGAGGAERG